MKQACQGSYMSEACDGYGLIPFERSPGYTVMLCRGCHYQEMIRDKICEAQMLTKLDEDGTEHRERCRQFWTELYKGSDGKLQRLCKFHHSRMTFVVHCDEQSAQPEGEASA